MSVLGLGLAALGRPGYINLGHREDVADSSVTGMEQAAFAVLDAAWEGGVRHFDAARSYGRAEAILGRWLASRAVVPDDVVVSSKWGYRYTAAWRVDAPHHEIKELSARQLRRQWRESRALLGDQIDLYQIHSATVDSGVLDDAEVRAELAAIRDGGVRIGLSATGPAQAATIAHAVEVGGFDQVQATWNLHERSAEGALAAAHEAGLTVYAKEALANGRLTAREASSPLSAAARERGVTEDQIALAAVLAQPWADVVLSGATTVAQLESNLGASSVSWDARLESSLAGLREDAEAYWSTRSALPWN